MKFTPAQKESLEEKVRAMNIAQVSVNDFLSYLRKEHKVEQARQVKQDLTGFEEKKPKKKKKA